MFAGRYNTPEFIYGDLDGFFEELNSDFFERVDTSYADALFETLEESVRLYRESVFSDESFSRDTKSALSTASLPLEMEMFRQEVLYAAEEKKAEPTPSARRDRVASSSRDATHAVQGLITEDTAEMRETKALFLKALRAGDDLFFEFIVYYCVTV